MLTQVAEGVLVHESEFIQSNAVVVQGPTGVLLVDPGITRDELSVLATDVGELGLPIAAGFSTHPHWDHVLWHPSYGDAPRYGTARCAIYLADLLSQPDWREQVAEGLPPEHADDIPMELLGLVTGLPPGATEIPWDGPHVRILEHDGHESGHAALLVGKVLVAGDMLSDTLIPFLNLQSEHPVRDYLAAMDLFDSVADHVDVVIPGHGSIGNGDDLRARIAQDRAYVEALRDGVEYTDPRTDPAGEYYWLADVHGWQARQIMGRGN